MSYTTYSVTQKDLDDYYTPKSDVYNLMIASINAGGYGQVIYNFVSTYDNYINSFNIWNPDTSRMEVNDPNTNTWYLQSEAGPLLWGVSSQQGLDFLNGTYDILGLSKLKYCNSCSDGNGLPIPTITSFKERTQYLNELMVFYQTSVSYLFYDYALPVRQNFFPAVMDPNIGNYIFKNYQGTTKTELQVAADTGIPREDISTSISEAKPILPTKTYNYLLRWCCNPNVTTIIELPYELSSKVIAFKGDGLISPPCWTAISTTDVAIERVDSVDEYEFCLDCQNEYGPCKR